MLFPSKKIAFVLKWVSNSFTMYYKIPTKRNMVGVNNDVKIPLRMIPKLANAPYLGL